MAGTKSRSLVTSAGESTGHCATVNDIRHPKSFSYSPNHNSKSSFSLRVSRLQAISLFSWSVEQNARDTQMTTRVTKGARRERHDSLLFFLGLPPSFLASRGFAAQRSRARALPSLNLKIKRDLCWDFRTPKKWYNWPFLTYFYPIKVT